jgi:hypothetical protein
LRIRALQVIVSFQPVFRYNFLLSFTRLFPMLLLAGNVGAAVCYAAAGDYRRTAYWIASAVCIAAVTF